MSDRDWDHELDVGFDSMDREHHHQARAVAALERAVQRGGEPHVIEGFLLGLIETTHSHFESEQELMRRSGYPRSSAHEQAHARLIEELNAIKERHANGILLVDADVIASLKGWLMDHIRAMDHALARYLQERVGPDQAS